MLVFSFLLCRATILAELDIYVRGGWKPAFAVLPHKTVTGKWIWLCRCFYRDVMVYDGGWIDEPDVQWAQDWIEILETM